MIPLIAALAESAEVGEAAAAGAELGSGVGESIAGGSGEALASQTAQVVQQLQNTTLRQGTIATQLGTQLTQNLQQGINATAQNQILQQMNTANNALPAAFGKTGGQFGQAGLKSFGLTPGGIIDAVIGSGGPFGISSNDEEFRNRTARILERHDPSFLASDAIRKGGQDIRDWGDRNLPSWANNIRKDPVGNAWKTITNPVGELLDLFGGNGAVDHGSKQS